MAAKARIEIGTLISLAQQGGMDFTQWKQRVSIPVTPPIPVNCNSVDLREFDVSKMWGNIPHRDWIMAPILVAGHYSMFAAAGGSGKSAVAITLVLALVTGRYDILQMKVDRPCKVIIINGEDGEEELMRRIRAACLHFGISQADVTGRLRVIGARKIPGLTFNCAQAGGVIANEQGLGAHRRGARRHPLREMRVSLVYMLKHARHLLLV